MLIGELAATRKLGPRGSVPPYVCLPKMHSSAGSAYLGAVAAPFVIDADPNGPDFSVPDIVPPPALAADRLESRKQLLAQVDRFQKAAELRANQGAQAVNLFQKKAFELMTSPDWMFSVLPVGDGVGLGVRRGTLAA